MRFFASNKNGFTMIELLVAIAIVGILASVIFATVQSGRKKAHDAARVHDLGQIQVALRLYKDANASGYPASTSGEPIVSGSGVGALIASHLPDTMKDPSGGNYYYHSAYSCGGSHAVLVALKMERTGAGNFVSTCGGSTFNNIASGVKPTADSYIVILK